jgi:hypothetical protein
MHIGMKPKSTQKVNSAGTSTQSAAISDNIFYVRVAADADCHIEIGVNPTATTSSIFLASKDYEYFKISPGEKIAVIGTVNLYITELTE